jgi:hypothetical protein
MGTSIEATTCCRTQSEAEELIAELCILTDNEDIKRALRKYQYGNSIKEIEKKLKQGASSKIGVLKEVLAFLYKDTINDAIPSKKDDIAHAIVCRIQNLLPDDCSFCKARFHLAIREIPFLPCEKCGQSSHKGCVLHLIGLQTTIENTRMDTTTEEIIKILNPLDFQGWHYLCKSCEGEVIAGKPNLNLNTDTNAESENEQDVEEEEENQPEIPTPIDQEDQINQDLQSADVNIGGETAQSQAEIKTTNRKHIQNNAKKATSDKSNVTCRFYKKGSCRHGKSGEECKFNHPELCRNYIQHGTRQPRGCNKGKDCKYFHPQMCINSLRSGKCLSQHCRFRHIKGTTRHNDAGETSIPEVEIKRDKPKTKKNTDNPTQDKSETGGPMNANHFLEAIRLLKAELLHEMDTRLKNIPQLNYPPPAQFQYIKQPEIQNLSQTPNLSQVPQVMQQVYTSQREIQCQPTQIAHTAMLQPQLQQIAQDQYHHQPKINHNNLQAVAHQPLQINQNQLL